MLVSVIIPIYNKEKYIEKCLNSLVCQDVENNEYEIICVDDGSTDNSLNILQIIEIPNLKIVVKENGGLSSARNAGIKEATGEYVTFVDPDDFVEKNCFGQFFKILNEQAPDVLDVGYSLVFENKTKQEEFKNLPVKTSGYAVWGHFYKRSILTENNVFFDSEVPCYGEDTLFNVTFGLYAKKRIKSDKRMYFYYQNNDSILHDKSDTSFYKRLNSFFTITKRMTDIFNHFQESYACSKDEIFFMLITYYRYTVKHLIYLPYSKRKKYITELKKMKLFPFKMPKEYKCDIDKELRFLGGENFENKLLLKSNKRFYYRLLLLLKLPLKMKDILKKL